jgi:hypothetical protein
MAAALKEYFNSPDFISDLGLVENMKTAKTKAAKRRIFSTFTMTVFYYIEEGDDGDMGIIDGRLQKNLDLLRKQSAAIIEEVKGIIAAHFDLVAKAQGITGSSSSSSSSSSPRKTAKRRSNRDHRYSLRNRTRSRHH